MKFSFSILAASLIGFSCGYIPINDSVQLGFDVWLQKMQDKCIGNNLKYGFILDASSISSGAYHDIDVLSRNNLVTIAGAIGPVTGIRGEFPDGPSISTGIYKDATTGVTVYDAANFNSGTQWSSVYSTMGADVIVFDIQDVGSRFYPRLWTLYDALVGAALSGKKIIVLDRPNPIGGLVVDGETLSPGFESQFGKAPIAIQHGMTIGELALLFNEEYLNKDSQLSNSANKRARLEVVKMKGWTRDMFFDQTGLNWFTPSEYIPTPDTPLFYPGQGLFSDINISDGRGTTIPFEVFGDSDIKDLILQDLEWAMNAVQVPGVIYRQMYFTPWDSKFLNTACAGLEIHIQDRSVYKPVSSAIASLTVLRDQFPSKYTNIPNSVDLRYGNSNLRTMLASGASYQSIIDSYQSNLEAFKNVRSKYLLY
ncbi:hypothetical protein AYI68_g5702 [Smittium mucronatum]|uniref:DUF1343 domain-containing protein n=1 Tax=Smittium mucronatum TaxID=133383 RepID=A0A1R0GTJ9_9FUNG|nr:hypothetical protein AYI68_g5702 [Smittium mucronatum]